MKLPAAFLRRLHWTNVSTAALVALLQRTPLLQVAVTAGEFTLRSPAAAVLRSSLATMAALGAVDTLAGATTLSATPPSPASATVGVAALIPYTVKGAEAPPASFTVGGNVPPGMAFFPLNGTSGGITSGTINASTIQLSGTPTAPGTFVLSIKGWEGPNGTLTSVIFSYTVNVAPAANTAPVITTQPSSQTAPVTGTVLFSVAAAGSPAPTYQWLKNGASLSGQTSSILPLSNLTVTDAGTYSCIATNSFGSATSNAATLTVTGGVTLPAVTIQPSSATAALSGSVSFNVTATGATNYQWRKNTNAISGATAATLSLNNLTASDAASYDVVVSNSAGSAVSTAATLLVSTGFTSRLSNVSVRTTLAANQILTVGFTMQGGPKSLLVRAAGPSLGALGVPGTMADPKLALFNSASVQVDANDNWGGNSAVGAAITAAGAFPFSSSTSLDAALVRSVEGGHTVQVSGPAAGNLIVEGYDAGTGNSPRLTNLSALNRVGTGADVLIAGFTIAGTGTKNILIRAIGPTLATAPFNLPGTLVDPKLELYNSSQVKISENDTWPAALTAIFSSVGAFPLVAGSKDGALIVNLPPGGYTVQVSGADGGTGSAIIEIYELP